MPLYPPNRNPRPQPNPPPNNTTSTHHRCFNKEQSFLGWGWGRNKAPPVFPGIHHCCYSQNTSLLLQPEHTMLLQPEYIIAFTAGIHHIVTARIHYGVTAGIHHGVTAGIHHTVTAGIHHAVTAGIHHGVTAGIHHGVTAGIHHTVTAGIHHAVTAGIHHGVTAGIHHTVTARIQHAVTATCLEKMDTCFWFCSIFLLVFFVCVCGGGGMGVTAKKLGRLMSNRNKITLMNHVKQAITKYFCIFQNWSLCFAVYNKYLKKRRGFQFSCR